MRVHRSAQRRRSGAKHEDTMILRRLRVIVRFAVKPFDLDRHSDRSAPSSGARSAALVAMTDDTSPAASTASNSSQPAAVSGSRARRARRRPARWRRARTRAPTTRPQPSSSAILAPGRSRTGEPAGSRRRAAAPARGAARARCAAAPPRARPCRPAGRARRASGTSRDRCSRRGGTPPAARRSSTASAPRSPAAFSIAAPTRAASLGRRVDQQEAIALLLGKSRMKFASDISSSPWKMLSTARPRAAAGPVDRRASSTISSPSALCRT